MSRNERKQFEIGERCLEIHEKYNWQCQFPGCDKKSTSIAHRIAKTKSNTKWSKELAAKNGYIISGGDIIHHLFNLIAVCDDLSHNSHFNIGFHTMEKHQLYAAILDDLIDNGRCKKIDANTM